MNEIKIGNIDFNTSCGCNSLNYPYGAIMFGRCHKQSTDEITGIKVVIANDSKEGQELKKMLDEKAEVEKIKEFIFMLVVKNKSISEIKELIDNKLNVMYENGLSDGKRIKQQEIIRVLGIY